MVTEEKPKTGAVKNLQNNFTKGFLKIKNQFEKFSIKLKKILLKNILNKETSYQYFHSRKDNMK